MSQWTHIVGALHIETYHESQDILQFVKRRLEDAPNITGSESNAHIFVNGLPAYTSFTNLDCEQCAHRYICARVSPPDDYDCCRFEEFQTRVVITICGDLRDRTIEQTEEEFNAFIKYLECIGFDIRNISYKISDALSY